MDYILDIIKRISEYGVIWISLIIIYSFIKIYKNKEEPESNLILKMIGFYILGCFSLDFNGFIAYPIVMPIGYIIYYFGMQHKERRNKAIKHKCAVLGISILALGFVNAFIYNTLEYRSYKIKNYSADVSKLDDAWQSVEKRLKLQGESLITEFRMSYDKNHKIENLYLKFTNPNEADKLFIVSSGFEGKLSVDTVKNEADDIFGFEMYNEDYYQTDVNEFMKIISNIKFDKSPLEKGKDIEGYHVIYEANNSSTSSTNESDEGSVYIIDSVKNNYKDIGFRKAKLREVPLKGILIHHMPMEKINEHGGASTNTDTYVLNGFINELLIKEDTESLLIENIKENKSIKYSYYDNRINEIVDTLEFYNWEETKTKDLKSSPYITLTDDKGAIIKLHENNYATYEDKEEKIVYKIPELTIDNILVIINKK